MAESNSSQAARTKPRIGITIGDPAGIGPEVSLKAVTHPEVLAACSPVIIGSEKYLSHWTTVFGLPHKFRVIKAGEALPSGSGEPVIYDLDNLPGPPDTIVMGAERAEYGRAAANFIETGVRLCRGGEIDALATAPINKKSFNLGGYDFPGHTEFLAHLTGTAEFAMAFFSPALRVALLTIHIPLSAVPAHVKRNELEKLTRLVDRELRRFGIAQPRIAVAALNPHGSEGGMFGCEEASEMIPAINDCRERYEIDVSGPHSGDTVFLRATRGEFDIVISCYHDQGLIPVKCMSFGEAVNVTLGLPFVRTSVDHGTAFDIAGKGEADPASMRAAIQLAAQLCLNR
ncbi:MAG: 4-hydroxythreonine-4-phosphate dehydrogenase PdxA [Blastocatellia bacterium]|nr:4-hydroxythreonine-4-phosphate dehydrogenase PdxA [Blastocatellia bacterium]